MKRFGLRSNRVLTPNGLRAATVVVSGEKIEAVLHASPENLEVEDLGEAVLFPGLVDCHVHINEPGRTEWEGFETATKAAICGGITTVVDMPLNCIPVTTTADALDAKLQVTAGHLHTDTGFWGGVVPTNAGALQHLARAGALGAKAFLCHSGIDDFSRCSAEDLRRAMPRLAEAGIPLLAHAELELTDVPPCPTGATSYQAWLDSRPQEMEDRAIALLIELCRETRCPVHIVHLSSASAVPMLRRARDEGLPITVETCPHYLCLNAESVPNGNTTYKCAPPIRGEANRQALWAALLDGVIDFVISDHSPCTPGLKRLDEGDFGAAWGGIASLSLGLSTLWTEAQNRGIGIERLGPWLSSAPAEFAGVSGRKGAIAPGRDADLVAWDPAAVFEVTEELLRFRHAISPYLGQTLRGVVKQTWLRGHRVFDGTTITAARGKPVLHRDSA